ncbi:unnamed protein product [Caenorhabditis nigoni]
MPCVENSSASLAVVQKDLAFWRAHEASFDFDAWCVLIPLGYFFLFITLYSQRNMPKFRLTRDHFVRIKILTAAFYMAWYLSIPCFLTFQKYRGVFFAIHIVSFVGLGTVVRMGIQSKQYTLTVDYTESLGTARTMFVMGCFVFIETVNAVNSPRFRYFECPESWIVIVEDISFKLMVFSHSIAYFVVKSMWCALRAEKLSICKNEKVVGKLVKRENAWIELYDTPH